MLRIGLALILVGSAGAALAADAKPAVGVAVAGVGGVTPGGAVVYLPAKDGGIEAVELATGKAVWANTDAGLLIGATDELVVGRVAGKGKPNGFRVVLIDAATGKTAATTETVELPEWARATGAAGQGWNFAAAALPEKGELAVVWKADAFYYGGAAPTQEILDAARKTAAGRVAIDPATGKITRTTDHKLAADDLATSPDVGGAAKAAGFTFAVEQTGFGRPPDFMTKRTLAVSRDGNPLWKRELAGVLRLPPPP